MSFGPNIKRVPANVVDPPGLGGSLGVRTGRLASAHQEKPY